MFWLGLVLGGVGGFGLTIMASRIYQQKRDRAKKIPITEGQWWAVKGIGAVQIKGLKYEEDSLGRKILSKFWWQYRPDGHNDLYEITPQDLWEVGTPIENIKAWRLAQDKALESVLSKQLALAEIEATASAAHGRAKVKKHI